MSIRSPFIMSCHREKGVHCNCGVLLLCEWILAWVTLTGGTALRQNNADSIASATGEIWQ